MADDAAPTAQQLLDEALVQYRAARGRFMGDSSPYVGRVAALAAAVQAEHLGRIADSLDRLERALDTVLAVDGTGATAVRTWAGRA